MSTEFQEFQEKLKQIESEYQSFCEKAKSDHCEKIQKLYQEYKQKIDFDDCLRKFEFWWRDMIEHCDQQSGTACTVSISGEISLLIFEALSKIVYPVRPYFRGFQSFYHRQDDKILFCVPHHWGCAPDKVHILELSDHLKLFTELYGIQICISTPHKIVWGN
jgi:hypothetical protein